MHVPLCDQRSAEINAMYVKRGVLVRRRLTRVDAAKNLSRPRRRMGGGLEQDGVCMSVTKDRLGWRRSKRAIWLAAQTLPSCSRFEEGLERSGLGWAGLGRSVVGLPCPSNELSAWCRGRGRGRGGGVVGRGMDGELTLFGELDQQRPRVAVYTSVLFLLHSCFFFFARHTSPMRVATNRGQVPRRRDYCEGHKPVRLAVSGDGLK